MHAKGDSEAVGQVRSELEFEKRLKFNVGDVGLAGCTPVLGPASQFPTTITSAGRAAAWLDLEWLKHSR